jgi:deoxyxylulose-5-phosphate synthase
MDQGCLRSHERKINPTMADTEEQRADEIINKMSIAAGHGTYGGDRYTDPFQQGLEYAVGSLMPAVDAAEKLAAKLKEIEDSVAYTGAMMFLKNHGIEYSGPTFEHELKTLVDALPTQETAK